jgi:hypothetical protein
MGTTGPVYDGMASALSGSGTGTPWPWPKVPEPVARASPERDPRQDAE